MTKTKLMRVDNPTYELVKAYAEEKDLSTACAIVEILACPIKRKALNKGEAIPTEVNGDNNLTKATTETEHKDDHTEIAEIDDLAEIGEKGETIDPETKKGDKWYDKPLF